MRELHRVEGGRRGRGGAGGVGRRQRRRLPERGDERLGLVGVEGPRERRPDDFGQPAPGRHDDRHAEREREHQGAAVERAPVGQDHDVRGTQVQLDLVGRELAGVDHDPGIQSRPEDERLAGGILGRRAGDQQPAGSFQVDLGPGVQQLVEALIGADGADDRQDELAGHQPELVPRVEARDMVLVGTPVAGVRNVQDPLRRQVVVRRDVAPGPAGEDVDDIARSRDARAQPSLGAFEPGLVRQDVVDGPDDATTGGSVTRDPVQEPPDRPISLARAGHVREDRVEPVKVEGRVDASRLQRLQLTELVHALHPHGGEAVLARGAIQEGLVGVRDEARVDAEQHPRLGRSGQGPKRGGGLRGEGTGEDARRPRDPFHQAALARRPCHSSRTRR